MASLSADHISLGYRRGTLIVRDLKLDIEQGEIVTLVGPNGSGKSTILRALARLMKPIDGAVYLDGLQVFNGNSDGVLTLSLEEHGCIHVYPPQPLAKSTGYNIKIVTERGSAFEGQYTTPPN